MGQGGLEPPTPRLSSVCSNQLSYWPPSLLPPSPPTEGPSSRPAPTGAARPDRSGTTQPASHHLQSPRLIRRPTGSGYAVSAQASLRQPPAPPEPPVPHQDIRIIWFLCSVQQSRPGVTSQPRHAPSGTRPGPPKSGMNKHYVRTPARPAIETARSPAFLERR